MSNYKKGKFINAMSHAKASDENESNTIVLAEPQGGPAGGGGEADRRADRAADYLHGRSRANASCAGSGSA